MRLLQGIGDDASRRKLKSTWLRIFTVHLRSAESSSELTWSRGSFGPLRWFHASEWKYDTFETFSFQRAFLLIRSLLAYMHSILECQ